MSRFLPFIASVFAFAGLPALAGALPPQLASYSAKAVYDIDNNHYSSTMIADHGRERRVIETPYGPQTLLIDPAAGKAYLIQSPIGTLALDLSSKAVGVDLTQLYTADAKPVGHETIDGLAVTKYHLVANPEAHTKFNGDVWSTADGIFVKLDGTGTYRGKPSHVAMHLTDIRQGPQDPSAFAVPKGAPVVDANPLVKQLLGQDAN